MAAEASTNGDTQTPAQKLEARLAQEESHRPTVEDVPDEDDLAHPAPSATLSEKAAGKQKAQDGEPPKKSGANPPLNIQSEEMFPGLGAPKAHTPAAVSSAWGRKPASVSANGVNGAAVSNGSSRASTPASGIATPTTPSVRGPGPQTMSLPGRYVESISLAPSQMIPRQQQKKPMQDVIRDINRRSKAKVEMKPGNMGNIVFQGTGPVDAVRSALRDVARELGSKVRCNKMLKMDLHLQRVANHQGHHPRFNPRPCHWPPGRYYPRHQQAHRRTYTGAQAGGDRLFRGRRQRHH